MKILSTSNVLYPKSQPCTTNAIGIKDKTNSHPSFCGEDIERFYPSAAVIVAKKYMYVKDNLPLIIEELYGDNNYYLSTSLSEVLELIEKLKAEYSSKDTKIKNLQQKLQSSEYASYAEVQKHKELSRKLDEANDKRDFERVKINKILLKEKRKNKVCTELKDNYIQLRKLEEKKYPNAIMVSGIDDAEMQESIINYIKGENCKVYSLDFDKISLDNANKEIIATTKYIKQTGENSLLFIRNFRKYTTPTEENERFINKLKGFMCKCAKEFNTTLLVFESHPEQLDENIIGGHRFDKKIDVSDIKGAALTAFIRKNDGYSMIYGPEDDDQVDLYLGNFSTNPEVLWIDSKSSKKINQVLNKIDKIKSKELFKYIKYIEFAQPDSDEKIKNTYSKTYRKTNDFEDIFYMLI